MFNELQDLFIEKGRDSYQLFCLGNQNFPLEKFAEATRPRTSNLYPRVFYA